MNQFDHRDMAALSLSAGWNQSDGDWVRTLSLSTCFGVVQDGQVISSIAVTCYGSDLAWIGMVLTLPEHRGKGHASSLMRTAIGFAQGRNIKCLKLDATEMGAAVYRKFGFEDECIVERWRSTRSATRSDGYRLSIPGDIDWDLDRQAFGADRRELIEALDLYSIDLAGGFACRREGRECAHFGPCVAPDIDSARSLAAWGATQEPSFWDLFPGNPQAVQLAHSFGFTPARKLLRMSYQRRDVDQNPALVYALAGFEWG